MSEDIYDKKSKYNNILSRIQKNISIYEGLFIIKKQYLTNNFSFYLLCILFRFFHLLSYSGGYVSILNKRNNSISFVNYLKIFSCYTLLKNFQMTFLIYCLVIGIIFILTIYYIIISYISLIKIKNYKYTYKWPYPSKFQIYIDHINFLIFPYIIEFLSFSYYMYFFPDKFIIKVNFSKEKYILIFIMIINTFLIIIYNVGNYAMIFCSNKLFTITIYEADLQAQESKQIEYNKLISFRCSNFEIYMFTFLQNFVLFLTIENYINSNLSKIIFLIIISIILLISILIIYLNKINEFMYTNYITAFTNILFFLCFYSIVLDFIIFILRYRINNIFNEIIYYIIKIFLSFMTYLLFVLKSFKFLESKIMNILFEEKNDKKAKYIVNCFYLLHEIMLSIKEKKRIDSAHTLIKFLSNHINNCQKINCNCKLLEAFLGKGNIKISNDENLNSKEYISGYLNILNYLFESALAEINIYNNYELAIILAEHFCHLKNNPTMSFSIISTLILKQRTKFSKFQMVILYELSQKYIYFISAKIKRDIEVEMIQNKYELLSNKKQEDILRSYYYNLDLSNKIKKIMNIYIDNIITVLQYKNIFEDSLAFQLDESNENILSVKINFFDLKSKVDNFNNNSSYKKTNKKKKINNTNTNLYTIIYLLKKGNIYYKEIIDFVHKIQVSKNLRIFFIYKYFIFFDIFGGGKIPEEVSNKLYSCLYEGTSLYSSIITNEQYSILKRKYKEQNSKADSKVFVLVEFKKELRTKYFTEDGALKLGYNQKDIINEKIDFLMPKEFCKSHQNAIKQLIIASQVRYSISKLSFYFNKDSTVLYPSMFGGSLIYNISKSLIMMLESNFVFEKEYRFMLNNNFELMANSRNFEDEYYLNQKIIRAYNINFLEMIKIKPENIKKKFANEYKKMHYQNMIRKVKTQEIFVPGFFVPPGDPIVGAIDYNIFMNSKTNLLSKILNTNNKEEEKYDEDMNVHINYDEEQVKLIKKENIINAINDLFISPREVVFHKTYNRVINKGNFIENLAKELTKIPDNDLMMEKDKNYHNLTISSKKLISKLLQKNELSNHYMKISFKLSFYYDKPFYFVTIEDEKKVFLNICKNIHFENTKIKKLSSTIKNRDIIPYNKDSKKSRNNELVTKKTSMKKNKGNKDEIITRKSSNNELKNKKHIINRKENEKSEIIKLINETKKNINKTKFIHIIKIFLSIIITCIIILYIILINYQENTIKKKELILLAYFYSLFTKNIFLGVNSIALNIYYDRYIVNAPDFATNIYILIALTKNMKEKYHNYTIYFNRYNLDIGQDFNILYKKRNFLKLEGYWQETVYESTYSSELDSIIYNILSYNSKELISLENDKDFKNFLFFKDRTKTHEKINCEYVKILYYLCTNYDFSYKYIFKEIENSIYNTFKLYVVQIMIRSLVLEIVGLILYVTFFLTVILYLYLSNNIIIKNIIFLFLDFSEENYEKRKINNSNIIILKLIELQNIINDFDLDLFKKYEKNIELLNKKKYINIDDKESISTNIDSLRNGNGKASESRRSSNKNEILNQLSIKNKLNKNIYDEINSKNKGNILFDSRNKILNNSSSHNYLVESNSQFFKDNLNSKSINVSKDSLSAKTKENTINSRNNFSKQNLDQKKKLKNENEDKLNIQDIILNKSNKSIVLMIKLYLIVIVLFILIVIIYFSSKCDFISKFNLKFDKFFSDLSVLTDRYMQTYYYYNVLRTLLIFPEGEKKRQLENIMEKMNDLYEEENIKFNDILSNSMDNYPETKKLVNIIKESKNNSTKNIKQAICNGAEGCENYLDSSVNIFDSGIDLSFKSCITQAYSFYMDYTKLINKTDIEDIKEKIILSQNSQFYYIILSLNYFYVYLEDRILSTFEADQMGLSRSFLNTITNLNIISIIFSILSFIFVIIFIFLSISKFARPIQDSTYRINCSFYYIKEYSLTKYKE